MRPPLVTAKIGLTGTSCVGKTSVIKALHEELGPEFQEAWEAAGHFFGNDYQPDMGDRFSHDIQARIQRRSVIHEDKAHAAARRKHAIGSITRVAIGADRTRYDAPGYLWAVGDREGAASLLDVARWWDEQDGPYDRMYLFDPSGVPYVNNEVRTEGEGLRDLIHYKLLEFFARYDIPHTLVEGTLEERVATVKAGINEVWAAKSAASVQSNQ